MKNVYFFICLLLVTTVKAQFNPSFEKDSNSVLAGWTTIGGKVTTATVKFIQSVPFTATSGGRFVCLENDSLLSVPEGSIINRFAFGSRPNILKLDAFYLPVATGQSGTVEIRMSRTTGSGKLDLLFMKDSINPVFSGPGTIPLQWNPYEFDLRPFYLVQDTLPDTCTIIFRGDNMSPAAGHPLLFIDNLRFDMYATGIAVTGRSKLLKIYPNPASDNVTVDMEDNDEGVAFITDLTGKRVLYQGFSAANNRLDLTGLANGFYQITIQFPSGLISSSKLIITGKGE